MRSPPLDRLKVDGVRPPVVVKPNVPSPFSVTLRILIVPQF